MIVSCSSPSSSSFISFQESSFETTKSNKKNIIRNNQDYNNIPNMDRLPGGGNHLNDHDNNSYHHRPVHHMEQREEKDMIAKNGTKNDQNEGKIIDGIVPGTSNTEFFLFIYI
jgi:hypothetical protein